VVVVVVVVVAVAVPCSFGCVSVCVRKKCNTRQQACSTASLALFV
jgi:hypothetical protein